MLHRQPRYPTSAGPATVCMMPGTERTAVPQSRLGPAHTTIAVHDGRATWIGVNASTGWRGRPARRRWLRSPSPGRCPRAPTLLAARAAGTVTGIAVGGGIVVHPTGSR